MEWIGVFHLLKKSNYVEICLNSIYKEYHEISHKILTDLRKNAYVRYREGLDVDGNKFSIHALDDCMENINRWLKQMLLGNNIASWENHTPNLMAAHKCNNFEKANFKKTRLIVNKDGTTSIQEYQSETTKTKSPKSLVEMKRLYEWLVMFLLNFRERIISDKDGELFISKISTPLKKKDNNIVCERSGLEDTLNQCIETIFEETCADDSDNEDNDIVDNQFNGSNQNSTTVEEEDIEEEDEVVDEERTNDARGKIHSLSLQNIFKEGEKSS